MFYIHSANSANVYNLCNSDTFLYNLSNFANITYNYV